MSKDLRIGVARLSVAVLPYVLQRSLLLPDGFTVCGGSLSSTSQLHDVFDVEIEGPGIPLMNSDDGYPLLHLVYAKKDGVSSLARIDVDGATRRTIWEAPKSVEVPND